LYLKLTQTVSFAILVIMRTNLNISLPLTLKQWVEQQIDQGGYGTASEYIRQLIREERKRQGRVHVEEKLQEALDSGEPRTVNAATWRESEKRVEERIKSARKRRRANGKAH
jgi:antitoxin ParD1/3/4